MIMPASEARKFGAPYDPEFDPGELRAAAFALEELIDKYQADGLPVPLLAARYARRAMFTLADRIERDL